MSHLSNRLMAASALALLAAAPALAQESGIGRPGEPIIIDQLQTGDIWSNMNVVVPEETDYAISTATSSGNAAAALVASGDVYAEANQENTGNVGAEARLEGGLVYGQASAVATAYGNSATSTTEDGNSHVRSSQTMRGDTTASVEMELLGGNSVSSSSTAIANAVSSHAEYGDHYAEHEQYAEGSVTASTDADLCCDGTSATFSTVAGGNAVTSTGETTTAIQNGTQTTASGITLRGTTDLYMYEATNAVAASTVAGNSYVLENQYGYTSLGQDGAALEQTNGAEVDAQTYVTAGSWNGYAVTSAYGVGNSALVSNYGSDTALYADQSNTGDVSAYASFDSTSSNDGVATLSSTAIGNAATASLCNVCGDAVLSGSTRQVNSGNVYSSGTMTAPSSGGVVGSASAIGNSATYQSGSS